MIAAFIGVFQKVSRGLWGTGLFFALSLWTLFGSPSARLLLQSFAASGRGTHFLVAFLIQAIRSRPLGIMTFLMYLILALHRCRCVTLPEIALAIVEVTIGLLHLFHS